MGELSASDHALTTRHLGQALPISHRSRSTFVDSARPPLLWHHRNPILPRNTGRNRKRVNCRPHPTAGPRAQTRKLDKTGRQKY